ncbi:MAG: hypothetical protein JNM68_03135 [Dinghuibacter sp.]|nr:hypothetical protein [Dinghuibacter sp.]
MKYFLCWLTCWLLAVTGYAQAFTPCNIAANIAYNEQQAKQPLPDSTRAFAYFKLFSLYRGINDTANMLLCLQKGIELARRSPFLKAASYYFLAQQFHARNELQQTEHLILKTDSLLGSFSHQAAFKVRGYSWLLYGNLFQLKGEEGMAMDAYINKALPFALRSGDVFLTGAAYRSVAIVLMNGQQRKAAAGYLNEALRSLEQAPPNDPFRPEALAETLICVTENYIKMDLVDSANTYLARLRTVLEPCPNSPLLRTFYYTEGICYHQTGKYAQALQSFNKGISLNTNEPMAAQAVKRLQFARFKTLLAGKQYNNAIKAMLNLLESPQLFTADRKKMYKELSDTYAITGNIQAAFFWAGKYITLSDSLYKAGFQNDVVELEKKYNNSENQKKISLLQAEKEKALMASKHNRLLTGFLSTTVFFLLILSAMSWLYYRNNRKLLVQKELAHRQQLREVKQEQQLQLAQALLEGEERERKRLAGELHDGLGGMLSGIKFNLAGLLAENHATTARDLPVVIGQLDQSVNELRRIARNMMPESLLRAGLETALADLCDSFISGSITIERQFLHLGNDIPVARQTAIYRIVQELLTNAVRHAHASAILLQCSRNENVFYITVEDNGIGFNTAAEYPGIGLSNIKKRVGALDGQIHIQSAPGSGTTINIEVHVT